MPDISLCTGGTCPKRERCHRFTAKPDPIAQSYFAEPPVDDKGECEYFWPDEAKKETPEPKGGPVTNRAGVASP